MQTENNIYKTLKINSYFYHSEECYLKKKSESKVFKLISTFYDFAVRHIKEIYFLEHSVFWYFFICGGKMKRLNLI
jgi:hypothetical protein